MMKFRLWMLLTIAMVASVAPAPAGAEALRGDQFLTMLTGQTSNNVQSVVNKANGMGYLQGLLDSYMVFSTRDPSLRIYCMPTEGFSIAQARRVVIQWLEAHPQRLHEEARILIFHALADAFPCPQIK
jgi:hypothetical protein